MHSILPSSIIINFNLSKTFNSIDFQYVLSYLLHNSYCDLTYAILHKDTPAQLLEHNNVPTLQSLSISDNPN